MNIDVSHGVTKFYNPNGGWNLQIYYPTIRVTSHIGLQILVSLFDFRIHPQAHAYAIVLCGVGLACQYKPISIPPE